MLRTVLVGLLVLIVVLLAAFVGCLVVGELDGAPNWLCTVFYVVAVVAWLVWLIDRLDGFRGARGLR